MTEILDALLSDSTPKGETPPTWAEFVEWLPRCPLNVRIESAALTMDTLTLSRGTSDVDALRFAGARLSVKLILALNVPVFVDGGDADGNLVLSSERKDREDSDKSFALTLAISMEELGSRWESVLKKKRPRWALAP